MGITKEQAIAERERRRNLSSGARSYSSVTKEQAIAERERRRNLSSGARSYSSVTKEQAIAERNRRRGLESQEPHRETSIGEDIKPESAPMPQTNNDSVGNPFVKALLAGLTSQRAVYEAPVHGALQPLLESGYLGQGVSDWSKEKARERESSLKLAGEDYPLITNGGELIGKVNRDILAAIALKKPVGALAGNIPTKALAGIPKWLLNSNLAKNIVTGGLTGGLEGATDYVNEGESRLENSGKKAAGGAIAGGVFSGLQYGGKQLLKLGKWTANLPKAFPKGGAKELADKIAKVDRDAAKDAATEVYDRVISAADKAKVKVDLSKIKSKGLLSAMNSAEKETLKKALPKVKESKIILPNGNKLKSITPGDQSFGNAHNVKKDLDDAIGRLEGLRQTTKVSNQLNKLKKGRIKVQSAMSKALKEAGLHSELGMFKEVNKTYADKVLKYNHPLIKNYLGITKGKKSIGIPTLTAEDFLKKAHGDSTFRAHFGNKYPEIEVNQLLPKYLKRGASALGIGSVGGFGYQLFKDK